MPLSVNQIRFFDPVFLSNTNEKTSGPGLYRGTQGSIFYIYSKDQDITYAIDVKSIGEWRQLAEGTAKADKLTVIDVTFFIPEARVRVKAVTAPTQVYVESYGYPAVYIREANDPDRELGKTREE